MQRQLPSHDNADLFRLFLPTHMTYEREMLPEAAFHINKRLMPYFAPVLRPAIRETALELYS